MEKTKFAPTAANELIREYCQEYMEKMFYFCLKKTGNPAEAEDLCSDISLQVIAGLKKGASPENYPAWVFGIARNRYSSWAKRKHLAAEFCDSETETDDIPDDTRGVEDDLILAEDINLLRRELALSKATTAISSSHITSRTEAFGTSQMRLTFPRARLKQSFTALENY